MTRSPLDARDRRSRRASARQAGSCMEPDAWTSAVQSGGTTVVESTLQHDRRARDRLADGQPAAVVERRRERTRDLAPTRNTTSSVRSARRRELNRCAGCGGTRIFGTSRHRRDTQVHELDRRSLEVMPVLAARAARGNVASAAVELGAGRSCAARQRRGGARNPGRRSAHPLRARTSPSPGRRRRPASCVRSVASIAARSAFMRSRSTLRRDQERRAHDART